LRVEGFEIRVWGSGVTTALPAVGRAAGESGRR